MARIVPSDLAPSEAVHYVLGGVEFDLGGKSDKKSFETNDHEAISGARTHPWLTVVEEPVKQADSFYHEPSVPAHKDPFSSVGPNRGIYFDAELANKAERAKREGTDAAPLAVESGLDQDTEEFVGDVPVTLAADDTHVAAKSAKAFETKDND